MRIITALWHAARVWIRESLATSRACEEWRRMMQRMVASVRIVRPPRYKQSINIYWSDEDGCYVAVVPPFPGCTAHGDTYTKAAREAERAMWLWIETAEEMGRGTPEPQAERPTGDHRNAASN